MSESLHGELHSDRDMSVYFVCTGVKRLWREVTLGDFERARRAAGDVRRKGAVMELCQVDDRGWVLERWAWGDLVALEAESGRDRCPVAGFLV